MGLLFDALLKADISGKEKRRLQESTVIHGDNVAEYFFSHDKDLWNFDDFPNIAPPFKDLFIESRLSNIPEDKTVLKTFAKDISMFGVQIRAEECDVDAALRKELAEYIKATLYLVERSTGMKCDSLQAIPFIPDKGLNEAIAKARSMQMELHSLESINPKWKLTCTLYLELVNFAEWSMYVDEYGKICMIGDHPCFFGGVRHSGDKDMELIKIMMYFCTNLLFIGLLTVSFMHCKNVVPSIAGESRKRVKQSHKDYITTGNATVPVKRFYVLNIEPMKKVLKTEGKAAETGLKKAVHICRGHFKDYREHGLFGKYKGLYWWDMHVKGNKESGIVDKEYSVKLEDD
jgi:hypothetical protein